MQLGTRPASPPKPVYGPQQAPETGAPAPKSPSEKQTNALPAHMYGPASLTARPAKAQSADELGIASNEPLRAAAASAVLEFELDSGANRHFVRMDCPVTDVKSTSQTASIANGDITCCNTGNASEGHAQAQ